MDQTHLLTLLFRKCLAFCAVLMALAVCGVASARGDWRADLSSPGAGNFPPLRPVTLEYECGWSGLIAGTVTARFSRVAGDLCELKVTAATTGFPRALWRMDATHDAMADVAAMRPVAVRQKEMYRAQTISTDLDFDDGGVWRLRQSTTDKSPARRKRYEFPNLYDLQTALLYVRSQALETGSTYRMVVCPGNCAYLATVTVLGREQIKVKAGSYPAIKIDLKLQKVNGEMKLEPHGKFKHATGWLSDDADRLPLRMNAQIFVGSVWVELQKVE
jgi:hypothetical protein